MNERQSHIELYQAMSPQEQNIEMKTIFDLLPDLQAAYQKLHVEGMDLHERIAAYEHIEEQTERRVNSKFKKDLSLRLRSLLSFSSVTDSCKADVLDIFDEKFELGMDRSSIKIGDRIFPSGMEFYTKLFRWDNPVEGGIFGKNAKEIDREAYKNAVWFALSSKEISEEMGVTPDFVEEMEIDLKKEEQFLGIAKQFETEERMPELEIAKKANGYSQKILGEDRKLKNRIEQWKIEFEKLYGEEP